VTVGHPAGQLAQLAADDRLFLAGGGTAMPAAVTEAALLQRLQALDDALADRRKQVRRDPVTPLTPEQPSCHSLTSPRTPPAVREQAIPSRSITCT